MPIIALAAALKTNLAGTRDGWPSKLLSSSSGETPRRSDSTMSRTTRATLALAKLGVKFTLHAYDYDPTPTASACRPPRRLASSRGGC